MLNFYKRKKKLVNVGEDVGVLESAVGDKRKGKKKKLAVLVEPLAKHTAAFRLSVSEPLIVDNLEGHF